MSTDLLGVPPPLLSDRFHDLAGWYRESVDWLATKDDVRLFDALRTVIRRAVAAEATLEENRCEVQEAADTVDQYLAVVEAVVEYLKNETPAARQSLERTLRAAGHYHPRPGTTVEAPNKGGDG